MMMYPSLKDWDSDSCQLVLFDPYSMEGFLLLPSRCARTFFTRPDLAFALCSPGSESALLNLFLSMS